MHFEVAQCSGSIQVNEEVRGVLPAGAFANYRVGKQPIQQNIR